MLHTNHNSTESDDRDFNDDLKLGSNLAVALHHYGDNALGLGAFYSCFISSAELSPTWLNIEETYTAHFLGVSMGKLMPLSGNRLQLFFDGRVGVVMFYDNIQVLGNSINMRGSTVGLGGGLGIEYLLNSSVGVGVSGNGYWASLDKLYVEDDDDVTFNDEPLSLNRLDINIGLRFYLR